MAILSKFGAQTIKINIADNIQSGSAGVMGDFNSRTLKVSINAENGEVLEDPTIKAKLLCKTEGDELIFTEGEYIGEGIYQVDFPNEVFEQEQELECIIQLSKEDEILYSRIFKRRVERGLLGTEREGTSTIIDLLKIMDFADHYEEKLKEMEALGNKEEADIIRKAKAETDKFNKNAKTKTDAVNKIKTEVEGYKDITVKAKDTTLENKADFDKNYNRVTGILDAETDRERAEEERRKHDKEIQDLINGGLDNAGFVKLEDLKETEKYLDSTKVGGNLCTGVIPTWSDFLNLSKGKEIKLANEITPIDLKEGDKINISFMLDFTEAPSGTIYIQGGGYDTGWGRGFFYETVPPKIKVKKGINIISFNVLWKKEYSFNRLFNNISVGFKNATTGRVRAKGLKIEKGTIGTSWTANDLDLLEYFNRLENDLVDQNEQNTENFNKLTNEVNGLKETLSILLKYAQGTRSDVSVIFGETKEILRKIEDSNRNYRDLLENDKDLIGGV